MKELQLKYGCNPNQKPSKIYMAEMEGTSYPGTLRKTLDTSIPDAFNGWQLLCVILRKQPDFLQQLLLKHVSPAGASIGLPLTETLAKILLGR